jgi:hypothetical protein
MKDVLLSTFAKFFGTIASQKAHWYQMFDLGESEANSSLLHATFPSLALLMKVESAFMQQLLLDAGLARKKISRQHSYIVDADHDAWDSFIANYNYYLNMETTYFTINKRRQLYIKVGAWCSSKHPPRTPGYIWKESLLAGYYDVPKLRISSVVMKLAKAISKHFSPIFVSAESEKKVDVLEMETDQSISSESATSNSLFIR